MKKGELLVKTTNMIKGYYKGGKDAQAFDEDGWLFLFVINLGITLEIL